MHTHTSNWYFYRSDIQCNLDPYSLISTKPSATPIHTDNNHAEIRDQVVDKQIAAYGHIANLKRKKKQNDICTSYGITPLVLNITIWLYGPA